MQQVKTNYVLSYENFSVFSDEMLCAGDSAHEGHVVQIESTQFYFKTVIASALRNLNIINKVQEFSLTKRDNVRNSF